MNDCDAVRAALAPYHEGELEQDLACQVEAHLDTCPDCVGLLEVMQLVAGTIPPLQQLQPPAHLHDELAGSPCNRWLALLFKAIDREISDANLARLLSHLDACADCRRTWNDLSLIHQVGSTMQPPHGLLQRCISLRQLRRQRRIIGRKTAIAAAYLLALLVGSPVTLARHEVTDRVMRVADSVSTEVTEVAKSGRGEARVMLWRAWQWGNRQVVTARNLLAALGGDALSADIGEISVSEERHRSDTEQGGFHE